MQSLRLAVVPAYILLCLLMGGASAAGYWVNMLLQLLAIPIIGWSLLAERPTPMPRPARQLLILLGLMLVLVVVQLIPLPPFVWTALPGRGEIVEGYRLMGMSLPWLPISVSPYDTVSSVLWLLPAIAVLLGILRLGAYKANWIVLVLIGVTTAAIAIGAIQRAGNDAAYFYIITNYGMATGFFSNANHMATLLMITMPFTAALYLSERARSRSRQRASGLLVLLAGVSGLLLIGIVINGSLAALGLTIPVIGASGLMLLSRKRRIPAWSPLPLLAITVAGIVLIFSGPLGNNLTTAEARTSPISRYTSFSNTIDAALDHFPAGSGIGTFKTIYPMYEDPATMTTTYVNHTHSDYLELFLETGLAGLALIALFLLWWAGRSVAIWTAGETDQYARAATIASAAILAHSMVDYPLRTAAISVLFALCCALMAEPRPVIRQREGEGRPGARHLSAD